jgi:hypothetical protein
MPRKSKSRRVRTIKSVADLRFDAQNANPHTTRGMDMMDRSLDETGFGDSVTVDRNGVLISGNARTEKLLAKEMGEPIVIQSDGSRPIIHQRVDLDLATDPKAKQLAVYQNRVGQINLEDGWNVEALAAMRAAGVSLDGAFSSDEWEKLEATLSDPSAPDAFKTVGSDLPTDHECPKCGYLWSGGKVVERSEASE